MNGPAAQPHQEPPQASVSALATCMDACWACLMQLPGLRNPASLLSAGTFPQSPASSTDTSAHFLRLGNSIRPVGMSGAYKQDPALAMESGRVAEWQFRLLNCLREARGLTRDQSGLAAGLGCTPVLLTIVCT